jgi:dolichol-phosphate mannosyltransferase
VIARLWEKFQEGSQVVFARRLARKHSPLKRATSWAYHWIIWLTSGKPLQPDLGSLSLIGRPVIDQFNAFRDVNRHYLHIVQWLGFDPVTIDYVHQSRASGTSSYSFSRLLRHAIQGLLFQNTRWLEVIVLAGALISMLGLAVGFWAAWTALRGSPPPGWASTVVISSLLGGAIIIIQGIVGLYVGQIFEQVKGRPLYVVAERVGGLDPPSSDEPTPETASEPG